MSPPLGFALDENLVPKKLGPLPVLKNGHDDHDGHPSRCKKSQHHVGLSMGDHIDKKRPIIPHVMVKQSHLNELHAILKVL